VREVWRQGWFNGLRAGMGLHNAAVSYRSVVMIPSDAAKLVQRIDAIALFAHAYAWHLNFRLGTSSPVDLLHFAHEQGLQGVKIHVEDGEARSLLHAPDSRAPFARLARSLGLEVHIETSATDEATLRAAIDIALDTGATSVRCYPRYDGPVSRIIAQTIADLRRLPALDPSGRLNFLLEQHEDLKSGELVAILAAVGNPRLTLLFDFANMINAFEMPLEALRIMAPHITDVHVKDAKILPDRGGLAHRACRSGEGDIPFAALLTELLLLGETPQVRAFACEEENEMYAPAYRFPDEPDDPIIPPRAASTTDPTPGEPLDLRLARERAEATAQIAYIRQILAQIRATAQKALS
jgi:sugar phosphate isomerase/epimerase